MPHVHNISLSLLCHQAAGSEIALSVLSVHHPIDLGHEVPELGAKEGLKDTSQNVLYSG